MPEPAPPVASYEKSGYREMPRLQDPRVLKLMSDSSVSGFRGSLIVETGSFRLLEEEREDSLRSLRLGWSERGGAFCVELELLVLLWRN